MSAIDLVKYTQKAILDKKPLKLIESKELADDIFNIVNSMDEKVVNDYIRYYCFKYIDKLKKKSTSSLSGKIALMSTHVYPLIAPKSSNIKQIHKLFDGCENTKKFVDKINIIGDEIKYEIFESFIVNNEPLKNLYGELFQKSHVLTYIEQYIKTNREKFGDYIDHIMRDGLHQRSLMNKIMIITKETHTIISYALIGSDNITDLFEANDLLDILHEKYEIYCTSLVNEYVTKAIPLKYINRCVINDFTVMQIFLKMDESKKNKYIKQRMDYHLTQREVMSFEDFKKDCVSYVNFDVGQLKEEYNNIKIYIDSLYDSYAKKLIEGNRDEINLSNDKWTLFFMDGPRIKHRCFIFDDIESETFRYEIKLFLMDECLHKPIKNINTLSLIKDSVNFLYNRDTSCDSFAKITLPAIRALDVYLQQELMVKKAYGQTQKRSVNTLAKTIGRLGKIVDFLIKYSKENTLITPAPTWNPFTNAKYRNRDAMSKRTEIIPDVILEQLDEFKNQLNPTHQLMYEIFQNTGMRAKSVCKLKANCLKPSRFPNVAILKYKAYKLENYKKKAGKLPYEELIIPSDLADKIQAQIDKTENLREKYNLKYIFLNTHEEKGILRASVAQPNSFVSAVNKIIINNNIVDYDGVFWHFTSRQCRKTLVSIMMDNNATDSEIAYVLGHHSQQTVNRYYKEINEQRIENLNHEFFKKKFGIDIGEEYLNQYSKEEQRCLYIDFVTNYRRVPLGYCTKPMKDGPCDKQSGASTCEKCPKICTGKPFVQEWIKLRDARQNELNDYVEHYKKNNIKEDEYCEYKAYQHILYELNLYQDAIDKINDKCNGGN